jgi:hypothetical protein
MENPDEISSSEVENRIDNLARTVKKFRIIASGASVLGGFGKLPDNFEQMQPEEQLGHLTHATNKFGLSGLGVDVAGTFDDGFKLS